MVLTFELTTSTTISMAGPALHLIEQHATMQAASAQLPNGAYTTFRTYASNRVLRLHQHIARLETSVALLGQSAVLDESAVTIAIREVLKQARAEAAWPAPEARFRLTFAPPQLFISIEPFTPYPASVYETGVTCITVSLHRDNPQAKSTTFINSAAQAYQALPHGAHEGLMVAEDGTVLEGLSSNFFAIYNGALHTEDARVLPGITRSLVLEVAASVLPISTRAVTLGELPYISECFITSVSREILPVVRINDLLIGDGSPGPGRPGPGRPGPGRPGPITKTLMARFADLIEREAIML